MSFRKKGRKVRPVSGKTFPRSSGTVEKSDGNDFTAVIAETLRETYGRSGRSIKTVMAYTGAGERAVKNWFGGKNGPNGENLVELVRHSDEVLEALLLMAADASRATRHAGADDASGRAANIGGRGRTGQAG